jgi:2-polyprenyl-6-methoxyphenol hydroxylase-like FAD-dependent oxidoreductase
MARSSELPVLIVGAGPTGLTLAAQLSAFGIRARLVDRSLDRARESRALAVQARTLEILQSLNLGETLVARGNPSARLFLHFEVVPRRKLNWATSVLPTPGFRLSSSSRKRRRKPCCSSPLRQRA